MDTPQIDVDRLGQVLGIVVSGVVLLDGVLDPFLGLQSLKHDLSHLPFGLGRPLLD